MVYGNIRKGTFQDRPNCFIAEVEINGKVEICPVKNTGRCKELLISGATVYVDYVDSPSRSTAYDLITKHTKPLKILLLKLKAQRLMFWLLIVRLNLIKWL